MRKVPATSILPGNTPAQINRDADLARAINEIIAALGGIEFSVVNGSILRITVRPGNGSTLTADIALDSNLSIPTGSGRLTLTGTSPLVT